MFINYYKIFEAIKDGSIKKLGVHETDNGNICLHLPIDVSLENKWIFRSVGEIFINESWPVTICHPKNFFEDYEFELSRSSYCMIYGNPPQGITFVTPDNRYDESFFEILKNKLLI